VSGVAPGGDLPEHLSTCTVGYDIGPDPPAPRGGDADRVPRLRHLPVRTLLEIGPPVTFRGRGSASRRFEYGNGGKLSRGTYGRGTGTVRWRSRARLSQPRSSAARATPPWVLVSPPQPEARRAYATGGSRRSGDMGRRSPGLAFSGPRSRHPLRFIFGVRPPIRWRRLGPDVGAVRRGRPEGPPSNQRSAPSRGRVAESGGQAATPVAPRYPRGKRRLFARGKAYRDGS